MGTPTRVVSVRAVLDVSVPTEQLDVAVEWAPRPDRHQGSIDPQIVLRHSSRAERPDQLANSQKKAQLLA